VDWVVLRSGKKPRLIVTSNHPAISGDKSIDYFKLPDNIYAQRKFNNQPMLIKQELIQQIQSIIAAAKERAIRSVDTERVLMYWQIGKVIFEEEQDGKERAGYGEFLIKSLSETLQPQFGSGFTVRQLERYRQFYRVFPIATALRTQFICTCQPNSN
jgi:hypothetical protein